MQISLVALFGMLAAPTSAFNAVAPLRAVSRAGSVSMVAPKGPFGGRKGDSDGWLGDNGQSVQVQAFENGEDYLFFQGPAPTTAVQDGLPSFFSAENFQDLEISTLQIAVTVVGLGTFAVLLPTLLS
ncbi:hypothetical protein Ctob_015576 [Chrysochromulina tobinii]|jgi:hypothetical protein|uniref:Uncharacterized protein n=1 Tax=Chrysochromulina tobinii TaxID=1460289 RepID=A0A0M0K8S4_9EUKA|nr:hypothetical protein Ctob_015576 [Chrysochromulina tobinii]|eukprot:KOO34972.1 hypothetical protein Ctob_015576 [Chrysochromulina sp. CCMP291]